jgi:glycosyltransferase involved in cell wall biosynthesis
MFRTPLMIVGDGPQEPTGLGRIARDLAGLIHASDLPVELVQVGGSIPPIWKEWEHYPLDRSYGDWGASYIEALWQSRFGRTPGILWLIWDPGRLAAYREIQIPVQKWAYTAVDSTNINRTLGGPARVALESFDRIIAYGRWGAGVIETLRHPVPYLPHGMTTEIYWPGAEWGGVSFVRSQLGPYFQPNVQKLVGCVATNQPRKDLGLFCHTLAELRDGGIPVFGWLHTDTLVKDWAIPQLIDDFGLQRHLVVTMGEFTDDQLAAFYRACSVTIAPGLGEGFGYPIVESLAAGTPVVHGDFGGGAELIPKREWRFPVRELRLDSVYALKRPVYRASDVVNAILRIFEWQHLVGEDTTRAYCHGAVAHLDWLALWPRWRSWIRQGLGLGH